MGDIKSRSKRKAIAVLAMLAVLLVLPLLIKNTYVLKVLNNIFLYSIIALSVNLILGFTGMLDFGRSAFVGIGTYSFAILMWKVPGVPWIVGFLFAAFFTAIVGYVVGMFLERTSFDYLTLITIGIVEIVRLFLNNCTPVTNGAIGITGVPAPSFFGYTLKGHAQFYYFCLFLLIVCYILISRLTHSYKGRALMAIREDEIAATYSAINLPRYKAFCFGVASFFTGIGGAAMYTLCGFFNDGTGALQTFCDKYNKLYNLDANDVVTRNYDAVYIAADAYSDGATKDTLADYFSSKTDFTSELGSEYVWDGHIDNQMGDVYILKIVDGAYTQCARGVYPK